MIDSSTVMLEAIIQVGIKVIANDLIMSAGAHVDAKAR